MFVTWATLNSTGDAIVQFGQGRTSQSANGSESLFVDGGSEKRHIYMHRVLLTGLVPGKNYGLLLVITSEDNHE